MHDDAETREKLVYMEEGGEGGVGGGARCHWVSGARADYDTIYIHSLIRHFLVVLYVRLIWISTGLNE